MVFDTEIIPYMRNDYHNRKRDETMKNNTKTPETNEEKRIEQLRYIMEHWDELPEAMQCRFEGQVQTARDFLMQKTG